MNDSSLSRVPTLSRTLFAPRYVLSTLEFAATLIALLLLLGYGETFLTMVAVSLAPVIVLFLSQHFLETNRRIRPIEELARRGLAGELDHAGRIELAEALVTFPRRVVGVRFAAWAITAAVLITAFSLVSGLAWSDVFAITGVCMGVSLVFLMWRAQWFRRAAERALLPALAGADRGRYLGRTVRERLFVAAYLPITGGAILAGLYDWIFLDLPLEGIRGVFVALPPLALVLTLTFAWRLFAWTTPLRSHLAGRPLKSERDGPWKLDRQVDDPGPMLALRTATSLPYRASLLTLVLWAGCSAFVGIVRAVNYGPWEEGVLLFAGLMAVALMAALIQLAWSRQVLQPARQLCATELGALPLRELWPRVRVRDRFIAVIVAVFFASSTFAYTTLYLQQRAFASAAAGTEANTALEAAWPRLKTLSTKNDIARDLAIQSLSGEVGSLLFLGRNGGVIASLPFVRLPRIPAEELLAGKSEVVDPSHRQTIAVRRLDEKTLIGLARPWRNFDGVYSVAGVTFLFVILGLVALAIALIASEDITSPIKSLRRFARQLGRGNLDATLPVPDPDEVGELGLTLDKMRVDLREQLRAVKELNLTLERKVEERTAELRATQAQLVHGEKMASVGRLAAGVAHEVNNPLNFIANALGPMETTLHDVRDVMKLEGEAAQRLRKERDLDASLEDLDDLIRLVRNGVQRTQVIVRGLRDFSRKDEGEQARETDLAALCDQTVALLRHELMGRIEIVRDYEADSRLVCFPGAMGQLLMNLIANAAQAISGSGRITILTRRTETSFELQVSDTGSGIPSELLPRVFDPFFTTKEVGKGSGLGLSIAHGIVERHGGRISVESVVGQGTTFIVSLPLSRDTIAQAS
jgi:signal transduction histidine kinase